VAHGDPSHRTLGISAAGSRFAHARKAPQVKPRRADCTARESVWESRSLPALIKASLRNQIGLFLFGNYLLVEVWTDISPAWTSTRVTGPLPNHFTMELGPSSSIQSPKE
jgi:hypothetical protein